MLDLNFAIPFYDYPPASKMAPAPVQFVPNSVQFAPVIPDKAAILKAVEIIHLFSKQPPVQTPLKRLETKPVFSPDELGHNIGTSLDTLEVSANLQIGEDNVQFAPQAKTLFKVAQNWVADCTLRAGSNSMQASLPYLLQFLFDGEWQSGVDRATDLIHANTAILDTTAGVAILLLKNHFLNAAQEKVEELKKQSSLLEPDQAARLRQLEGVIHHERQVLSSQMVEQGFRGVKNGLSIATFILAKLPSLNFYTHLEILFKGLAGLVSVGLAGFLFYHASKDDKTHIEWAQDFQAWQKNHAINQPEPLTNKQETARSAEQIQELEETRHQLIAKRSQRQQEHLVRAKRLTKRVLHDDKLLTKLKERVKSFQRASLQEYLNQVNWSTVSLLDLKSQLEAKMEIHLEEEQVIRLYQAYTDLERLKQPATPLSPEEQQEALSEVKTRIVAHLDDYLKPWIELQPLAALVEHDVDHHAILNPVIKESLTQMIHKKQEIEGSLLKFKFFQHGIQFSAATVFTGITLTLAIIALATNPVGAAGLILLGVSIASFVITSALVSASFYYAYRKKPRITAANMKGAYGVLAYYQLRSKLAHLREKIENYLKSVWQHKRDQIAQLIHRRPLLAHEEQMTAITALDDVSVQSIQQNFQENVSRAKKWEDKAFVLQKALEEAKWADFAEKAELIHTPQEEEHHPDFLEKGPLDTLETFNELLNQCDLSLLSTDVQELIEKQLGIPLAILQTEIEQNSFAVKKLLRNFFNLDDSAFINFIGRQRYLEKELSPSFTPTGY